jgi:hypothetical protein
MASCTICSEACIYNKKGAFRLLNMILIIPYKNVFLSIPN